MKQPDIEKINARLTEYSQSLKENYRHGEAKLILAIADLIEVISWSSEQQDSYSKKLVKLTQVIVFLTIVMVVGLIVQIIFAL